MTLDDSQVDAEDSLMSLLCQGLACGTILYVAFFEILERERSKATSGILQWTLLLLGFLCILGMQVIGTQPIFFPSGPSSFRGHFPFCWKLNIFFGLISFR